MILCVSYPVDVCYVIIYTKKKWSNPKYRNVVDASVLLPVVTPTFVTRPEFGFGLSLNPSASFVFLLVNRPARSCLAMAGGFDDFR
jgi:hypothetical protein